jgi:hypothetical protein
MAFTSDTTRALGKRFGTIWGERLTRRCPWPKATAIHAIIASFGECGALACCRK